MCASAAPTFFLLPHRYFAWINSVNPIHFGFEALAIAQWRNYGAIAGGFPFADGTEILDYNSLHSRSFEANVAHLACIGAFFRAFAFLAVAVTQRLGR